MQWAVLKRVGSERLEVLLFPGGDFSQAFRVSERWGQSDGLRLIYRARGLTTVYPSASGEVRALKGVDLDLCAGEMVVLLGAFSAPRDDTARELRNRDQKETLIIRASCAEVRTAQTRPALDDPWFTARLQRHMNDKAPAAYALLTHGWVFVLSLMGGVVAFLQKLGDGNARVFNLIECIGELCTSALSCQACSSERSKRVCDN